jgi:hypothetical protein
MMASIATPSSSMAHAGFPIPPLSEYAVTMDESTPSCTSLASATDTRIDPITPTPSPVRARSLAPAWRAAVLRLAAIAVLLIGYADLAWGGLTVAPVFLVVGYLILVPAALMTRESAARRNSNSNSNRMHGTSGKGGTSGSARSAPSVHSVALIKNEGP